MKKLSFALLLLTTGCVVYQPPPTYTLPTAPPPAPVPYEAPPPAPPPPPVTYEAPPPQAEPVPLEYESPPPPPVVSVYVDPPIDQPPAIAVPWAPPPMLVEEPPPPPLIGAVWIGGFWVWQGMWVWDHGRWAEPPRPAYVWVSPYYENRSGVVIFVTGHWAAVRVAFVPPPPGIYIAVERPLPGVVPGPACIGPEGVFVPPPPGSRHGIIIPAPLGTAPAVVTSAPPVVNVGMRITNVNNNNTTVVNNVTNITNVTNVTRVTIVAPASATATGQAVNTSVPAQAHLAAALPAVVKVAAPPPATRQAIPAFARGRPPVALPPPQAVHAIVQAPRRPATAAPVAAPPMAPRAAPPEMTEVPGSREAFDRREREREPRAGQQVPMAPPPANAGTVAPFEGSPERRERAEPRLPNTAQPAVNPNERVMPPKPAAATNPPASPPKPAAAAPKNTQNPQASVARGEKKPEGKAQGGEKRNAAEKEKQKEKPKEGEKDR